VRAAAADGRGVATIGDAISTANSARRAARRDVVKGAAQHVAFDITRATIPGVAAPMRSAARRCSQSPACPPTSNGEASWSPNRRGEAAIWKRGGEGAILKRLSSRYQPGYRSPDWLKVKAEHTAVLTIIGFEMGKSGPYSTLRLRDAGGHETTVKTLGNQLLRDITAAPDSFLGREVVITYQERTPAGFYRHGRFDHFTKE
jgi:hypothetical protein